MCLLCEIQKWSRRVATMLPWLVIPLIGLWALSQLLPPAFRFEITSPRLACVFVLLVTLFWYEVLMPQLSAWRVRRKARLRERKRSEAIELEKLKKTATRRCRNCSTPYRDQNPGGGRFMCSYCGHISKRPVLDMPVPPGLGLTGSGILKGIVRKGGKMMTGKRWSESGWTHGQEWSESDTWTNWTSSERSSCWSQSTNGGNADCLVDKSYSGGVVFACRLLTSLFLSIWRKIFRFSSSRGESSSSSSSGTDQGQLSGKNGETETRVEKARRKAEEKRQARLEKELLEEEERKQREEVARLVEERRRIRDEKINASAAAAAESCRKTSEEAKERRGNKKKRQERKKDRDKTSSKSNSDDADEMIKKNDGVEHQRHVSENLRGYYSNKTSTGSRYFDRMKGTILSSSKALTDNRFFNSSSIAKDSIKPINSHTSLHSRELDSLANAGERNTNYTVASETQINGGPRKSWHQLFSRSSSVLAASNPNVISRPNVNQIQNPPTSDQSSSIRTFDNPISFGLPSPFTTPNNLLLPQSGELSLDFIPEETELFEDPCYVPDPISLLGPVSESLDITSNYETALKKTACEVNKPSPIGSPLSKSRISISDEKQTNEGTWQMWKSSLGQDSLSFVGGEADWSLTPDTVIRSSKENANSLFAKEDPLLHSAFSEDRWSRKPCFPELFGVESRFSLSSREIGDVAIGSLDGHDHRPFELPCADHGLKKVKNNNEEDKGGNETMKGLFQNQDLSFW